ncbi:MAG: hypothetical protein DRN14_07165, partial [Thermoplasmata archaeon]
DAINRDIDSVFGEMIRLKMKILQKKNGWSDEQARGQDIHWDTDVIGKNWEIDALHEKMNMIADFSQIDRDKLHLLYREMVPLGDTSAEDYSLFCMYTKGSALTLKEHVVKFVSLLRDDFIEHYASEYGEPGYTKDNGEDSIITADWNGMPDGILNIITSNGYVIEWSDEWVQDYEDDKLYRSSPDSWSWEPSFFFSDEGVHGIEGNEELYISTMIGEPHKLLSAEIDPGKYGFVDLEGVCHETGWYGKIEDPADIFDFFEDEYSEMVVQTCSRGQFSINWKVWGRNTDA